MGVQILNCFWSFGFHHVFLLWLCFYHWLLFFSLATLILWIYDTERSKYILSQIICSIIHNLINTLPWGKGNQFYSMYINFEKEIPLIETLTYFEHQNSATVIWMSIPGVISLLREWSIYKNAVRPRKTSAFSLKFILINVWAWYFWFYTSTWMMLFIKLQSLVTLLMLIMIQTVVC